MRLKLKFSILDGNSLPINYKYEFSSWIYKVFYNANPEFAGWLHKSGYSFQNKRFKLFTFSDLNNFPFSINRDRIIIISGEPELIVSFQIDKAVQHFIEGLFINQRFSIGDKISRVSFVVSAIEKLPIPTIHEKMMFKTISPMIISRVEDINGEKKTEYLEPEHEEFGSRMISNLEKKKVAELIHSKSDTFSFIHSENNFSVIGKSRRKKITIKAHTPQQTELIGFEFQFKVKASPELLRLGYFSGFGEKNSLGFGCVELI